MPQERDVQRLIEEHLGFFSQCCMVGNEADARSSLEAIVRVSEAGVACELLTSPLTGADVTHLMVRVRPFIVLRRHDVAEQHVRLYLERTRVLPVQTLAN
jgi:hypothetical protein